MKLIASRLRIYHSFNNSRLVLTKVAMSTRSIQWEDKILDSLGHCLNKMTIIVKDTV